MALVTYSDSEASDSEAPQGPQPAESKAAPPPSNTSKRIVDRGNPRKIRVNLADSTTNGDAEDEEHARKRPRVSGGESSLSGFNSMLPEPKRAKQEPAKKEADTQRDGSGTTKKVFGLKTSATPGFDRQEDAGPDRGQSSEDQQPAELNQLKAEEVVPKGNAMMFKPLSMTRNTGKKKKSTAAAPAPKPVQQAGQNTQSAVPAADPSPVSKSKVSLFGSSVEEKPDLSHEKSQQNSTYEPLIYNSAASTPALGPAPPDTQPDVLPAHSPPLQQHPPNQSEPQSLENIAADLNLSQAEMRQLLGRRGQDTSKAAPKILTFNTDEEYKSNAEYLSAASDAELANQQHNPVRAIAPGKHNLQQLVNAVSNQRNALEDSFASGKRNRKEASSRYGW